MSRHGRPDSGTKIDSNLVVVRGRPVCTTGAQGLHLLRVFRVVCSRAIWPNSANSWSTTPAGLAPKSCLLGGWKMEMVECACELVVVDLAARQQKPRLVVLRHKL